MDVILLFLAVGGALIAISVILALTAMIMVGTFFLFEKFVEWALEN